VPSRSRVGAAFKACASVADEPFTVTLLEPIGSHLRLLRLKGLRELVRVSRPSHILVDADPASLLVYDVLRAARSLPAKVWAMTAENLERNYLREGFERLRRGRLGAGIGGFAVWWLLQSSRRSIDRVFTISQDGTRVMSLLGF